jgi:hypothetical protein
MDLNQLLFQHQLALMKIEGAQPSPPQRGSRFDLIRHYERRIDRLRHAMGVSGYPRSA